MEHPLPKISNTETQYHFSISSLQEVGSEAMRLAKDLHHTSTYPIHLLYGLSVADTPTGELLRASGLTPENIRQYLASCPPDNFSPNPYQPTTHGMISKQIGNDVFSAPRQQWNIITSRSILDAILQRTAQGQQYAKLLRTRQQLPYQEDNLRIAALQITDLIKYVHQQGYPYLSLDRLQNQLRSLPNE